MTTPIQKIVLDHLRPEDQRDAYGVALSGLRDALAQRPLRREATPLG